MAPNLMMNRRGLLAGMAGMGLIGLAGKPIMGTGNPGARRRSGSGHRRGIGHGLC